MNPLRIALVTRRYWPLIGGPATATALLAAGLRAAGHEARIVTPQWRTDWPQHVTHHGTAVERLPISSQLWANYGYGRALAAWLRDRADQLDIVYVSGLKHDAAAAVAACRDLQLRVVLRPERAGLSGDCHWQIDARFGRRIKYRCMDAAAIVAPSPTLCEEVIAAGYPRDRIHAVPLGVPVPPLPNDRIKAISREILAECHLAFQVPAGAPVALFLGRFEPTRSLDHLVRAWATVVRELPDARLWLIGEGPLGPKLFALAESLELRERLVIGGPFDCVDEALAAADVYVAPQSDAGTSLSLLQAMAATKPICASDIPDHRHFLNVGSCGMLVRPDDPAALAAGLLRLLRDPGEARRLGQAAHEQANNEFSLDCSIAAHVELFQSLAFHSSNRKGVGSLFR